MLTREEAALVAARLAASFPNPRVGKDTLVEWAEEFVGVDSLVAEVTLERIKSRYEKAPTIRQLRSAMFAEKNAAGARDPWLGETSGLNDPCEFCGQSVKNGPDAASRYDSAKDRWYNAHLSCADERSKASHTGEER